MKERHPDRWTNEKELVETMPYFGWLTDNQFELFLSHYFTERSRVDRLENREQVAKGGEYGN